GRGARPAGGNATRRRELRVRRGQLPAGSAGPARDQPHGPGRSTRVGAPSTGAVLRSSRFLAMANILVWGKTRDVVSGQVPAGIAVEEADTLAAVQAEVDGKGAIL